MPVHNVSQLTQASDYLIWRILDVYTEGAKFDEDLSGIESIGMDETSIAKDHDYSDSSMKSPRHSRNLVSGIYPYSNSSKQ